MGESGLYREDNSITSRDIVTACSKQWQYRSSRKGVERERWRLKVGGEGVVSGVGVGRGMGSNEG